MNWVELVYRTAKPGIGPCISMNARPFSRGPRRLLPPRLQFPVMPSDVWGVYYGEKKSLKTKAPLYVTLLSETDV